MSLNFHFPSQTEQHHVVFPFISYSQTPTLHVSLNGSRMKKIPSLLSLVYIFFLHGLPHPKMDEEILCKLYHQSCKALRKQIKLKR